MGYNMKSRRPAKISRKAVIAEKVQRYVEDADWMAAIVEMEKLFAICKDPLIRVRIGDARRKLNHDRAAIREYVRAAELFTARGCIAKALAQYALIVRLDSSNYYAWSKREMLLSVWMATKPKRETMEYQMPLTSENVVAQYSCVN